MSYIEGKRRWPQVLAIAAVLVALAVWAVLTAWPVGAQDAPPSVRDAETLFDYAENGTEPVTTYRATDPENNPIFWTVGGPDAADFTIVDGVLRFKTSPNFEVPTDRPNDEDGSGATVLGEGAANNVYKVTVRFGAGGEDGTPGEPSDTPPDEYDGDDLGEIELTITVTNVNEPGMVVISPRQPQVGTELTAILTDKDNIAPGRGEWQWARSTSMTEPFTDIAERSRDSTYRPTSDDLGQYLRVTVEYVDRAGAELREVKAVSDYPVRVDTNTSNQDPKFPDQSTLIGGAGPTASAPTQGRTATDRFIPETAIAGTRVGAPVTAFDDKTDIEVITYSLRDADGTTEGNSVATDDDGNADTPVHNDGHAASFDIDAETGQVTVGARAMLDADEAGATNPYTVVVRAVDGDGDTQNIDVAIHVLKYHEPPNIDRVYQVGRVGEGHSVGDRVPTEISHWEADRTPRSAIRLDADLESGVLDYSGAAPALRPLGTGPAHLIEAATYYATDDDAGTTFTWTLEGDDEGMFSLVKEGAMATLAFTTGPDFEKPEDENEDNVYEVTIVVTDGTVDIDGNSHRDELPVTVKVINSDEDNEPGTVKYLNRVPEVSIALEAELSDPDTPISELNWQWYRSTDNLPDVTGYPNRCPDGNTDGVRYFIDTAANLTGMGVHWEAIPGATSDSYTPGYDEDSGGTVDDTTIPGTEVWSGGDIGVSKSTDDEGNISYSNWSNPRCLRATVTYRDSVDRTHTEPDDAATLDVDETLEGTFQGTEYPVKPIDEENDAPEFLNPAGDPIGVYRADDIQDIKENTTAEGERLIRDDPTATNLAATDPEGDEDDTTADILTYSLSGPDAGSFTITGTVDNPGENSPDDDGILHIKKGLDYETKKEYRVTVTATDPSDDHDSVDVIVNITNVNEGPKWSKNPGNPMYKENGTADVATYVALDPEGAGITYSLVDAAITDSVDAADIADIDPFEISSTRGILRFKASPNYEDPEDSGPDNMYQVVVKAEVADDTNPRHFITQIVTITVINVHEAPVFSKTTDTLEIWENPDDPENEATLERGELYLLNRGVGKPAANLPVEPNLDVGIPIVAVDDDNTSVVDYTGGTPGRGERPIQLIDGLTYTLSGEDAAPFHIVPATGQILTREKLDYETTDTYVVTVTATDPWDLSGSIDLTINVIDVDEQPIPKTLRIGGERTQTHEENGTDAVGDYTLTVYGDEVANPRWTLEGSDASNFRLDGTGMTRSLEFKSAPDFEMPRGRAMTNTNTNTYMVTIKVTDPSDDEIFGMFGVTVTVTNVDELGTLSGSETARTNEGATGALGTYTLAGTAADTADWSLDGADMSHFMLDGTGMSRMLKFRSAPDYENPRGAAKSDTNTNTYMVTVMAKAGGEMETVEVTITVDNVNELGTISGPARPDYMENGAGPVATYTATSTATATWSLEGTDRGDFTITGGMLRFRTSPDYESPADAGTDNVYMVTVKAVAGGEEETKSVTVTVTNVDEEGVVTLTSQRPYVGEAITASLSDPDDSVTGTTWQWARSSTADVNYTNIAGATSATYTPVEGDAGMYLRATASYTDGEGSGQSAMATSANAVAEADSETLLQRYDANENGTIQRNEVNAAIDDYFDEQLTKAQILELITLYFSTGN